MTDDLREYAGRPNGAYRARFAAANSLPRAHGPMPSPAFAAAADAAACSSSVRRSVTMCERGLSDGGRPVRGLMLSTIASTESLANPDLREYGKCMTNPGTARPARPFRKGNRVCATGIYSTGNVAGVVQSVRWDGRMGDYLVTVWFPGKVGGDARLTAEYLTAAP